MPENEQEQEELTLAGVLALHKRIGVTGEPRSGKTTISRLVTDRTVIHTDPNDLKARYGEEALDWDDKQEVWDAAPSFIMAACADRECFFVEGVTVARALRKGLEVDAVIFFDDPVIDQTPKQAAMGKGVQKIFAEWRESHPNVPVFDGAKLREEVQKVERFTRATLDSKRIERTPQGGIRVPARVTKVGVFEYRRPEGKVREYRPVEEVSDPASYMTLKGATVTVQHPYADDGEVRPDNYRRLNVGHGEDPEPTPTGDAIDMWLVINDAATITAIENEELTEVSCGYENERHFTPGVTPAGEQYDVVQRAIRYNHIALLPPGHGRQGPDVGLTLDANDNQIPAGLAPASTEDAMAQPNDKTKKQLTTDGDDPNKDDKAKTSDEGVNALTAEQISALQALAAVAPALIEMAKAQPAAAPPVPPAAAPAPAPAPPSMDEQKPAQQPAAAPAAAAPPQQPRTMDAAEQSAYIAETVELHKEASTILGEGWSPKGKSNRQIRLDVIKSVDSDWQEKVDGKDRTEDAVNAAYDFAIKMRASQRSSLSELNSVRELSSLTTDASERPPVPIGQLPFVHDQKAS